MWYFKNSYQKIYVHKFLHRLTVFHNPLQILLGATLLFQPRLSVLVLLLSFQGLQLLAEYLPRRKPQLRNANERELAKDILAERRADQEEANAELYADAVLAREK